MWIEVSERAAALLLSLGRVLLKGRTHKYIRRVPKPGGGYRYYYKTSGVTRSVKDDLTEGAKFKLRHDGVDGHFEVVGRSGDTVTLRHDESGGTMQVSAGDLADLLKREHADVVQAQRERTAKRLAQARKTGTPKQIARMEAEAKRFGVVERATAKMRAQSDRRRKDAASSLIPVGDLHKQFKGKSKPIPLAVWRDGEMATKPTPAVVKGNVAVHKSLEGRGYVVTHAPSGLAIAQAPSKDIALYQAEALHRAGVPDDSDDNEGLRKIMDLAIALRSEEGIKQIRESIKAAKGASALTPEQAADAMRAITDPPRADFELSKAPRDRDAANQRALKFASKDPSRAAVYEVALHAANDRTSGGPAVVASDGHRLIIVPTVGGDWSDTVRDADGNAINVSFPDYDQVVGAAPAMDSLDAKHLRTALTATRRLSRTDDGSDAVGFESDGGTLFMWSDAGGTKTRVPVGPTSRKDGERFIMSGKFLSDALQGAKGAVRIGQSGALKPVHVQREDGEYHVIMPMKP